MSHRGQKTVVKYQMPQRTEVNFTELFFSLFCDISFILVCYRTREGFDPDQDLLGGQSCRDSNMGGFSCTIATKHGTYHEHIMQSGSLLKKSPKVWTVIFYKIFFEAFCFCK